ncbi:hypothetical protein Ahy_B02g060329 [Arachis hypogaea]|uniref:CCHC-type domain-containing protein n=1 Tax=Arachis hypogaea TaxID=3818 RepID=A0A445AIE4_ARAHY|nr:hypothetical protein Ahy_B02g060329 [Arachis hypogaea]
MPIIDELEIELYVEFENVKPDGIQNDSEDNRAKVYEGMNSDSKEDFEATYEAGDKDEDGDVGGETAVENVVVPPAVSQPMDVAPFMRNLNLNAMNAPKFLEHANIGVADPKHGEFRIGMEYSSKKSVERLSCRYVIAYCANQHLDWQLYVNDVYRMTEVLKVYRFEFVPLDNTETWLAYPGPTLVANPALWQTSKGHPKLTRYLNEMDSQEMCGPWICRLCGRQGHSQSQYPQRARPSRVGDDGGP